MRYLLIPILALLLALPASAAELLIVQGCHHEAFDQAVQMLQSSCGNRHLAYVMSDYAEFDLERIVREEQPRVVVAVGDNALQEAAKLRGTAVVYTMALLAEEKPRENVTGISLHASPELYLKLLRKLQRRRAGIVYNRARSGVYIDRVNRIAVDYGVELVLAEVDSPGEVAAALLQLKERDIDALWMLPDTTAVTTATLDAYFRTAAEGSLPLISFSRDYLKRGALAAFEASRTKLNLQLCDRVTRIIGGADPAAFPVADIAEAALFLNETVAKGLDISLSGLEQSFQSRK